MYQTAINRKIVHFGTWDSPMVVRVTERVAIYSIYTHTFCKSRRITQHTTNITYQSFFLSLQYQWETIVKTFFTILR